MYGYKPPKTTRVSIVPSYHKIWNRTWADGSLKSIAPEFIYEKYLSLDKRGKYEYILDIIHSCMLQLSDEYEWDKAVFEKAHKEVLENDFRFKIEYPAKVSRDKKKSAKLCIEKTDLVTSLYATILIEGNIETVKLFDKRNWWWYDSIYKLAKTNKWFDNDRFGVQYKPLNWAVWYSIKDGQVVFEKEGTHSNQMNIDALFKF